MKVSVDSVVIRERVRHDLGDLKPLMESMRRHGQLNPITLTRDNELIAGHRRLLAARTLAWQYIDATIVDRHSEVEKLTLELEENVHRKDFSPEELLAGYRRLERLQRPTMFRRVGNFFKGIFARLFRRKNGAPTPRPALGTTADITGAAPSAAPTGRPAPATKTTTNAEMAEPGQYGV